MGSRRGGRERKGIKREERIEQEKGREGSRRKEVEGGGRRKGRFEQGN